MKPWRSFSFFLLFASLSISLYFGINLGSQIWRYCSMGDKVSAKAIRWEIEEEASGYAIWVEYEYLCKGKILTNRSKLPGPIFLNEWAAEGELRVQSKNLLTAYYDPAAPAQSALERAFPMSYGVRFILSFLVSIYFLLFKKKLKSLFN